MSLKNFRTYQLSVNFTKECAYLKLPRHLKDQLNRASSSIALNLAEGSGKHTLKEKRKFYNIAYASLRECQAVLDISNNSENKLGVLADKLGASLYKLLSYYGPVT